MRTTPEISFRKTVTTGSTYQWHRMDHKTCLLVWHTQPAQWTQSVTSGENENMFKSTETDIQSQSAVIGVMSEHWVFDMFQTLAEILKETPLSQLDAWSPVSIFKRVWALLPYHKRPSEWEGMDPRQARWTDFVHARRGSPVWDRKWWWPSKYVWDNFELPLNRQSMSDTGYSMLGAGAWGSPREMLWRGRWEGGSCLGMHVRIKDFKILKINNFKNK